MMQAGDRFGAFEIEDIAGGGGMSSIYRARDRASGQAVALKLLGARENDADAERFLREAHILAELRHPAIVRYVAHGRTPAGEPYLALEWLDGEDLSERLRRGGLSAREAVRLARRLAGALGEAHARGVVHRDLKPSNVFLPGGSLEDAKLLDFGVARSGPASEAGLTRTGVLVGTPSYMAPEQVRGTSVDARTDLFALGCLLYECLVGKPAFVAEHLLGVLARILFQDAPRVRDSRPDVPPALDEAVARLLSKSPDDRPPDAAAAAALLDGLEGAAGEAAEAPAASLSAAEQRVVSVVLAANASAVDGEARAVARRFGATLERVTSGTLMAALAARGPAVDQAAAAASLALQLRAALPEARVAVATGRALLGAALPFGEAIDRAARLLESRGGGVWLDEVTAALLADRFEIGVEGDLVGAREGADPRTLLGRSTPCVGREHELALLDATLAECAARPEARAVLVTAASGVGKTRLAREWLRGARGRARVVGCRGDAMSAGTPFLLAGQVVRRAAGIVDDAPPAAQRATLEAHVAEWAPPAEHARLVAFLGELARIETPSTAELEAARESPLVMGDQLRLAWEDWIGLALAAGPLVVLVEDLHWGDAPSVQLLDAALRAWRERPLMVLALARREVHELFPDLWGERGLQEIRLPELSRRASEELARVVLGERLPAAQLAWIGERAGGNALCLEEVIRAVAEGQSATMPASVLAMVQARLATLPADDRLALRAGSVFGEASWRGGVAALLGREPGEVAALLEDLTRREVLSRRRTSRFAGEAEYVFRHALFRDAAYSMLTDADRALGHRLAAEWLMAAGEKQSLLLAEHLERGGEPARAIAHYLRAAEEALAGNDFPAAVERAARGVSCGAEGESLGRLRLVQAEAHNWRGAENEAEWAAQRALDHLPPGSAAAYDAGRQTLTASLPGKRALLERVIAMLAAPPEPAARHAYIMAACTASKHIAFHGELARSWELLHLAEAVARELPDGDPVHGWVSRARGSAYTFTGEHDAARREHLDAAARFEAAGDLRNACYLRNNVGWLEAAELGLHAEAEARLAGNVELARRLGMMRAVAHAKQNLAVAVMWLGRLDEARALLDETVEYFRRSRDARMEGGSRFYLTLLYTAAGDLRRAEAEAKWALELASDVPTTRACTLAALARTLVAAGRGAEAVESARESQAILDKLGGIEEGESLIRLALAEALAAVGSPEADAALERARARLAERAAKMSDERVRKAFLESVPENAATLRG